MRTRATGTMKCRKVKRTHLMRARARAIRLKKTRTIVRNLKPMKRTVKGSDTETGTMRGQEFRARKMR